MIKQDHANLLKRSFLFKSYFRILGAHIQGDDFLNQNVSFLATPICPYFNKGILTEHRKWTCMSALKLLKL